MNARDSRLIEDEAAAWLARRDGSAWSDRDAADLEAWIAASTAHRIAYLRLESAWAACARLQALGAGTRSSAAPAATRRSSPAWTAWAAASLAAAVIAGVLGWGRLYFASEDASYATTAGEMRTIELADGSSATLSSDSAIDVHYTRRERRIGLRQGEAFFSVAHDARRPFTVAVGARRAVAVGTRFAVRRDPDELRIIVTEGVVRFDLQSPDPAKPAPSTLLTAGAVATARGSNVLVRSGTVAAAERALSWRSGYLSFHDTPLATAAAEFNRYGPKRLVIGDAAVGQIRIGGNFRWSNSEAFAQLLEDGFDIRVEREAERIVLYSR